MLQEIMKIDNSGSNNFPLFGRGGSYHNNKQSGIIENLPASAVHLFVCASICLMLVRLSTLILKLEKCQSELNIASLPLLTE